MRFKGWLAVNLAASINTLQFFSFPERLATFCAHFKGKIWPAKFSSAGYANLAAAIGFNQKKKLHSIRICSQSKLAENPSLTPAYLTWWRFNKVHTLNEAMQNGVVFGILLLDLILLFSLSFWGGNWASMALPTTSSPGKIIYRTLQMEANTWFFVFFS